MAHRANPKVRAGPYGARQHAVLNRDAFAAARTEIANWPGYAPTLLVELDAIARIAGVARVAYKDESTRFGLGSFKALGGAYAVLRQLRAADRPPAGIVVTCATDGNHGRSVAWGAQRFGCKCVIYIHATVSEGRAKAIAAYGAEIRRVTGTYDDAVRQAAADAAANGWIVVSDTSYPGYTEIPRDVMQGYAVMVDEALAQLGEPPTHVFVQAGVGGLAAAVCGHLWEALGDRRPRTVVVEPDRAACLFESARLGKAANIGGALDTAMAGLACGETSLLAWEILEEGAGDFMTVTDEAAFACMRLLAPQVVAGESAVAGMAALLGAAARPDLARRLGLDGAARVLLFGSEGDTDPELYRRIVGA
ncbi:MAG: diaminopropionate ammonia-lyase [Proteobacteria bacterium]|nr:diaminopropionate ammonia-lyase [Pseudomonadota bacterium]